MESEGAVAESNLDSHAFLLCSRGGRWRHSAGVAAASDFALYPAVCPAERWYLPRFRLAMASAGQPGAMVLDAAATRARAAGPFAVLAVRMGHLQRRAATGRPSTVRVISSVGRAADS